MPSPGKLVDAITGPRKLARPADGPYNKVFVSPSKREASTLAHAKAGLQSPDFHNLINLTNSMPGAHGGSNGIGFWKDGAEESRIVNAEHAGVLAPLAARLGKAFNQKGVLTFAEGKGSDIAHVLHVPHGTPEEIAEALNKHGIEYKTIVPDESELGAHTVHIIDMGGGVTPSVEGFAREAGARHDRHIGTANFHGGDTREEAHQVYDRILAQNPTAVL